MGSSVLLIATSNMGKVKEINELLKDLHLEIKTLQDFCKIESPEETGKTFFENAYLKAKYWAEKTGLMCLADDSGLEVEALNNAPGVYSSRFAGENATDEENNRKLLELLQGIPFEKRKARFVCVIVVYHPSGKYITTEGTWEGVIGFEPRGSYGFGYDPIFLVPEYDYKKTAAELAPEEKNKLSHRGKALIKLKEILPDFLKSIKQ
ncbi:MAG: non-canonical purine NTP pyrophosphatase [Thermodesulfobacterium geofontis]|uniref:dITP/XTP pyrophosphatase n=1 Tax=Thermodesulfobacterium geofontis TaxID=1295609 RepID=A0A2N7PQL9_9BACT|nr:MAG: non-canonical purine NTP pyrophosphatase [Thermodesulfobacterium geofontis]PMP93371.1 MAG: non-canonical purine NTP pyrophosphatase [Thermodesulfobacterium geofontis]